MTSHIAIASDYLSSVANSLGEKPAGMVPW